MTDQPPPPEPPRLASLAEVRILGGFFFLGGLALLYFIPRDIVINGVLPAHWFSYFILALGAVLLLFPSTRLFRERAHRFTEIGEQLVKKRDK